MSHTCTAQRWHCQIAKLKIFNTACSWFAFQLQLARLSLSPEIKIFNVAARFAFQLQWARLSLLPEIEKI